MTKVPPMPARLFLLCASCFFLSPVFGQTGKADFETTLIAEFCDSFTKASPRLTKENLNMEMGMMMLSLMTRHGEAIKTGWGLTMDDQKGMEAVGEKIGQLAAMKCPSFRDFVKANLQDIVNDKMGSGPKTYTGKLLKIEGQPFVYLLVQNKQGRTDKLYWLEYFEGADKLTARPNAYLNQPVTVHYREMEIYHPAEKEYKAIKVVSGIERKP